MKNKNRNNENVINDSKIFMITTKGLCTDGTAIVVARDKESAKLIFEKNYPTDNKHRHKSEHEIVKVEEIHLYPERLIFYDDGDR